MMQSMIPIIKIQADQYLIGTDLKWLEIKGINIMVRVGGGFTSLQEFISNHAATQLNNIFKSMEEYGEGFVDTISRILKNYQADPETIKEFKSAVTPAQEKNMLMTI